jgi:predicted  nucleic acid-binding Zn-ribbon protein|tara:strand:- start:140 stop:409 length:270 start_codon:yes stop_codon:yes gene_type:complete
LEKKNKVARGEDNLNKFLTNNWSIVVGLLAAIFTAGTLFSEFTALKTELTTVHERLDKKIKVINDLEERIVEIEKELQYDKGYSEGKKE